MHYSHDGVQSRRIYLALAHLFFIPHASLYLKRLLFLYASLCPKRLFWGDECEERKPRHRESLSVKSRVIIYGGGSMSKEMIAFNHQWIVLHASRTTGIYAPESRRHLFDSISRVINTISLDYDVCTRCCLSVNDHARKMEWFRLECRVREGSAGSREDAISPKQLILID